MESTSEGRLQDLEEAGADSILEDLRAVVAELSEGELDRAALEPDAHIFDHGYVDSLSAVMFLDHIRERWGVEVEDMDLVERYNTLSALAGYVHANR